MQTLTNKERGKTQMSKLSKFWKSWNSPKDVLHQVAKALRKHADDIATWADRQMVLPEPFESYDGPMIRKAVLGVAAIIEKYTE